jgi:Ca2+-binding EF-hand superfamily protein
MLNLLILAAALPMATAQPGDRAPRPVPKEPVSKAEALEKASERFAAMDLDGNGEVTLEELEEGREIRRAERRRGRFDRIDANDDGVLTEIEIRNQAEDRFDAIDEDGDGAISPEEFREHAAEKAKSRKRGSFRKG